MGNVAVDALVAPLWQALHDIEAPLPRFELTTPGNELLAWEACALNTIADNNNTNRKPCFNTISFTSNSF